MVKTGIHAVPAATKSGVPDRVGIWQLVRHVPGEHAHFLYASNKRTVSLFVTETKNNRPLQLQKGWKPVILERGVSAFMHQDSRHPERSALVFKHKTQRRMVMGHLTESELVNLAKRLR
nr:hypothetical protein [Armatimonas sp.]